jgi:hypothetical protein
MDPVWIRKQTLALGAKGRLQIDDVKLAAAEGPSLALLLGSRVASAGAAARESSI